MSDQWERQYDPSELFMSERWIASLFEPVRKSFFNGPQPPAMTFFLPGKVGHDTSSVAHANEYSYHAYRLQFVRQHLHMPKLLC